MNINIINIVKQVNKLIVGTKSLQNAVLKQLHISHFGLDKAIFALTEIFLAGFIF